MSTLVFLKDDPFTDDLELQSGKGLGEGKY